jgi:hypothetical protein
VEPPIPEDTEADVALLPQNSSDTGSYSSVLAARGAFAPHSSEAAALRGLGAGPSALTRVAAGLLLREVLAGVMSGASIEVAVHGLLLPALHMQVGATGLCALARSCVRLMGRVKDRKGLGSRQAAVSSKMAVHGLLPLALHMQVGWCIAVRRADLQSRMDVVDTPLILFRPLHI